MKLINNDYTDLSKEGCVILATTLVKVWSTETLCYRLADALDAIGVRGTLVQTKKMHLNRARRAIDQAVKDLEVAFDASFEKVFGRIEGREMNRAEAVQRLASFETTLTVLAMCRAEGGDDEKLNNMIKAIRNFKQVDDIDADGIMKLLKLK
jgi:hypothetical protein